MDFFYLKLTEKYGAYSRFQTREGDDIYECMSKVEVIICRNENMIFRKQKSRQLQAKSTLQARTQLMSAANKCSELHLYAARI